MTQPFEWAKRDIRLLKRRLERLFFAQAMYSVKLS